MLEVKARMQINHAHALSGWGIRTDPAEIVVSSPFLFVLVVMGSMHQLKKKQRK